MEGSFRAQPQDSKSNTSPSVEELQSQRERLSDTASQAQNLSNPYYHFDDISLYMAWQNWYFMQYSNFLANCYIPQLMWFYGSALHTQRQSGNLQQNQTLVNDTSSSHASQGQASGSGNVGNRLHETIFSSGIPIPQQNNLQQQAEVTVGVEVTVASLPKRIGAEFIDFVILLVLKILVISVVFGDKYIERFQYILLIDEKTTLEDLQLTLLQALLFRILVIAYEGYCLSGTLPFSTGKTIGKHFLGLEVMCCETVADIDIIAERVRVFPGGKLGAWKSMVRATLKNMIISVFFPAIILPFHFMSIHNRLIYDVATGTIVINSNQQRRAR